MESTGGRAGRREKAQGRALRLDKSNTGRRTLLYFGGYGIVNSEHLQHIEMVFGDEITVRGSVVSRSGRWAPRGLERRMTLTY